MLLSQRTLGHHLKPCSGFSAGVNAQLYSAAKLDKCEEREKYALFNAIGRVAVHLGVSYMCMEIFLEVRLVLMSTSLLFPEPCCSSKLQR